MHERLSPQRSATRALLVSTMRALLAYLLLILSIAAFPVQYTVAQDAGTAAPVGATPGSLQAVGAGGRPRGLCPLKHTDVRAEVSGFISRVTVTQEFENPFDEKIEAVYVFPLPQSAAVDDMTMLVGGRTIKGKIMRREQAEEVYSAARAAGQVASLLDQERPNVFTQSVANIMPGERVTITISYVETLKYEEGTYEFTFPMVVGPRYIPGAPAGRRPRGVRRRGTDRVPDASRITPPAAPQGTRAGHDVSVEVALDAGVPVEGLKSPSHEIEVERPSATSARVRLKSLGAIPNKDFVLRYDVAGQKIEDAVLTHRDVRGGYFTLILQPPDRVTVEDVTPKELVFVLDTSGSMSGPPIEKAKETMRLALEGLYPQDTFNLITFSGDTHILFEEPVPATRENLAKAQKFLETREGGGGTEMMEAIKAALEPSDSQAHLRIVCFMTDGYVGNDFEIISEVQKHPNARVFSFGVGSSVNRFLLDKMAEHGLGAVEYVSLEEEGTRAARRFHERVRNPLLTDITVDWGGLQVADVYPRRIPDLFGAGPVILSGRYTAGGRGRIRLRGRMSGHTFEREMAVELPESQPDHDVLATLWARRRVEDLLSEDYEGAQRGETRDDLREAITGLGLEYRLLTQFTSFVAVEEMTFTDGGKPRRIDVPVELPEGVSPQDAPDDEDLAGSNAKASPGRSAAANRHVQMQTEIAVIAPVLRADKAKRASAKRGLVARSNSVMLSNRNVADVNAVPTGSVGVVGGTGGGGGGGGGPVVISNAPPAPPAPTPRPQPKTVVSGGVMNGKVVSKPRPAYPPIARAAGASGTVAVQVVVDESGRVVSAQAVSGHPLLQQAAVAAARRARFSPTLLSGRPVKVSGVVTYNFNPSGATRASSARVDVEGAANTQAEAEEERRQQLRAKLHPLVASVVERLRDRNETPGPEEATFIRDGKAELRIRLSEKSPAVLAQLKQLGFEIVLDPQSSRFIIGRLPVEKLAALLDIEAVLYVSPQQ